jgi:hypothetical protein
MWFELFCPNILSFKIKTAKYVGNWDPIAKQPEVIVCKKMDWQYFSDQTCKSWFMGMAQSI